MPHMYCMIKLSFFNHYCPAVSYCLLFQSCVHSHKHTHTWTIKWDEAPFKEDVMSLIITGHLFNCLITAGAFSAICFMWPEVIDWAGLPALYACVDLVYTIIIRFYYFTYIYSVPLCYVPRSRFTLTERSALTLVQSSKQATKLPSAACLSKENISLESICLQ